MTFGRLALLLALAGCHGGEVISDLGLAAHAALRVHVAEDATWLYVNQDFVYGGPGCYELGDWDVEATAGPRVFRLSDDLRKATEVPLRPDQIADGPTVAVPVLGPGVALITQSGSMAGGTVVLVAGDDALAVPGVSDGGALDVVAEPQDFTVWFIDWQANLTRVQFGTFSQLATLDPTSRIVSLDATTLVIARLEGASLVLERRDRITGDVQETLPAIPVEGDVTGIAGLRANGTPDDLRVYLQSRRGDQVLRVRDGVAEVEFTAATAEVLTRVGTVSSLMTLVTGAVTFAGDTRDREFLALPGEVGPVACEDDPEVFDQCGARQFCRGDRAVGVAPDGRPVSFFYQSKYPADTTIRAAWEEPQPVPELTPEERIAVRVVSLVRALDYPSDDGEVAPTLELATEEPPLSEVVQLGTLAFGESTAYRDLARAGGAGGADGTGIVLDVRASSGFPRTRLVLPVPDPEIYVPMSSATVLLWSEPGSALQHTVHWQQDPVTTPTPILALQSDANAATGARWWVEETFAYCEESNCPQTTCLAVERTRPDGPLVPVGTAGQPLALWNRTRLFHSPDACGGEPLFEETWTADDVRSRVVVAHALAPTGAAVLTLPGGP